MCLVAAVVCVISGLSFNIKPLTWGLDGVILSDNVVGHFIFGVNKRLFRQIAGNSIV